MSEFEEKVVEALVSLVDTLGDMRIELKEIQDLLLLQAHIQTGQTSIDTREYLQKEAEKIIKWRQTPKP